MTLFLNDEEVAELTGIKRGKDGTHRYDLQVQQLRKMAIPFYVSAIGKPVIARGRIEGIKDATPAPPEEEWQSDLEKAKGGIWAGNQRRI